MPVRYLFVCGTFLLSLLLYIDRACISVAKEPIAGALSLSDKQMGWVLSAFALGYALAQTPSGMLADRLGARRVLAAVVVFWSLFTALTGAAWNYVSILVARFLFGAGEAGAFPGMARATFSWIPLGERGLVTGINFSASRLGGAFALPLMAWMLDIFDWRTTFFVLGGIGFIWSLIWFWWFRDDPAEHPTISEQEKAHILATRQQQTGGKSRLNFSTFLRERNMLFVMVQYFCSNFTFFFCLTWLFPYVKERFGLDATTAGLYASIPLLAGCLGNIVSGALVDKLFRDGKFVMSRRGPAIVGFALAAIGLVGSLYMESQVGAIAFLSLAIFGADMTLSPSWSFCVDIGGKNAGAVSGTMNMAGNVGSFVTALAFPYLQSWFEGSAVVGDGKFFATKTDPFFFIGAILCVVAIFLWLGMRPDRPLKTVDTEG